MSICLCLLIGSADFLGLNHYTTYVVISGECGAAPSHNRDTNFIRFINPESAATRHPSWLVVCSRPYFKRVTNNFCREILNVNWAFSRCINNTLLKIIVLNPCYQLYLRVKIVPNNCLKV